MVRSKRKIKKRSGKIENFSASKLVNAINRLTKGIKGADDFNVILPIISKLDLNIPEEATITTKELDEVILSTISQLITNNPLIMDTVANRQLRTMIKKEVIESTPEYKFSDIIKKGVEQEIYNKRLLDFDLSIIDNYLKEEESAIESALDKFSYIGIRTLADRYLTKTRERTYLESIEFFFMRVALGISKNISQAILIFNKLIRREYMHSTPTLFNSGLVRSQLSSCYVTVTDDSLESIMSKNYEQSFLMKYAGGIGDDVTRLRAEGSMIKSLNAKSSGPIPFIKVRDSLVNAIQQGGRRRSSLVEYMQPWHYNIDEFIALKEKNLDPAKRLDFLNTALWMPDEIMRRIKEKEDIYFFDPAECPELIESYGEDFTEKYNRCISKALNGELKLWRKENGYDWFIRYMSILARTGHPWLTFKDRHNETNPVKDYGVINSSNLCVTGDTYIHTINGMYQVKDLYYNCKDPLVALYDSRTTEGAEGTEEVLMAASTNGMHKTASNAPVYKIKTKDGYEIKATEWHDFFIYEDYSFNKVKKIKLRDLKKGDWLLIANGTGMFGTGGSFESGYELGSNLVYKVPGKIVNDKIIERRILLDSGFMRSSEQFIKGVILGIVDMHGTLDKENKELYISGEIGEKNAKLIQIVLSNFGIKCTRRESELYVRNYNLKKLLNLLRIYRDYSVTDVEKEPNYTEVESIEYYGIEDVFDTTQLVNHTLIFNGIVTGNCTEISLPNSTERTAVCTLASINLAEHVEKKKINEQKLRETVRTAITALDSVLDFNYYPSEESKKHTEELRPLGLGVMGFAEALIKMGVPYDSDKAVELADEFGRIIKEEAIKTSELLAEEYGPFPVYNPKVHDFKPRRNSHLLAIAPTASIGIITNTSSSIESYYSNIFSRDTLSGKFIQVNKYLIESLSNYNEGILEKLKISRGKVTNIPEIELELGNKVNLFKTAFEIPPERQIDIAAAFQKHVDQAISRNIYIPSNRRDEEEMASIYVYAWEKGLKSTYYCFIEREIKTEQYTTTVNKTSGKLNLGAILNKAKEHEACPVDPAERASCESCQ